MAHFVNTRQFAAQVGVTPETVRRWIRAGKLVSFWRTPTGQLRFTPEQVAAALLPAIDETSSHKEAARAKVRALRKAI